jgi:Protein of unknown function (DUF3489)
LHFAPTGVIDVSTAPTAAKEKSNDIDHRANKFAHPSNRRDEGHDQAPRWRTSRARRAPKPKPGKKATTPKKAPKGRTKDPVAKPSAGSGSKTAKILDLLRRPGGASARDLFKASGWQPHSLRGFLSGTVGEKMGLTLTSTKGGGRVYSLKA